MGEAWRRRAEGGVEAQLPRRTAEQVVAAHYLGDLHREVVDHHRELIGRHVVGPPYDEITHRGGHVLLHEARDAVVEGPYARRGREAPGHAPPQGACARQYGLRIERPTGARVHGFGAVWSLSGQGHVASAARAGVHPAHSLELLECAAVEARAEALEVRGVDGRTVGAFVPVEPEPRQVGQRGLGRTGRGACGVEVFDAHHPSTALRPHRERRRQRRTRAAHVERPGGRRRKPPAAQTDLRHRHHCAPS